MIISNKSIRVRYDEVDKMGFVYHGNYARYFHIGRTHLLRKIGICDKTLEKQNIIMPVVDMSIRYIKPVFYDDKIRIKTTLLELSGIRLKFLHDVYNQSNEIINIASSQVVFVDAIKHRSMRIPDNILDNLKKIT